MNASTNTGKQAALLAFGHLLKRLRLAADLTQEELAERAMVSARLISDLERGTIHRPRRDTAELLADGLDLRGPDRDAFIALARGRPFVAATPELATTSAKRVLPLPPTPIVGRLKEMSATTALLLDPAVRLLTLTGPGGVGKTRLALAVAAKVGDVVPDGVVFVDLAPLRDPDLVVPAMAQALGLVAAPELPPRQQVLQALREKRFLLLLDNFEHLASAAGDVAELVAECPKLTVLATSRTPLRIRAEHEYPVGPLALPERGATTSLAELGQIPAVDLFIRRAEAANRAFALTSANASEIAEIAIRLDGLPLAIELAATRIKVLSPAALLARLERRLPLLTGGAQDLPARQQTMRATLNWSHDLLAADEQILFRRLAVFAGGFTLEAAEWVSPTPDTLDLLAGLVDKSLLRVRDSVDEEQRFGMLETMREYGRELLAAAGEEEAVRDRHLAWCVHLAERAAPELDGANREASVRRLDVEHDNLRSGLGWAVERRDGELAQRLGGALSRFWVLRGHYDEGRRWLDQALLLEAGVPPIIRAGALLGMARIAYRQGDYEAGPALEDALALFRAAGDSGGVANTLAALGMMLADKGDYGRASALEDEALAIFQRLGDQAGVVRMYVSQGLDAYDQGDYDRATTLLEEALTLGRSLGLWHSVALALNNLALVAQEYRDYDRAMTLQAEALELCRGLESMTGIADSFENLAMFTSAQQQPERAVRLFGAAAALRVRIGAPGRPSDRELLARFITAARTELGEAAFLAAWSEGEAMPLDEAIDFTLAGDRAC